MLETLLLFGLDVNMSSVVADGQGETAMELAVRKSFGGVVRLLRHFGGYSLDRAGCRGLDQSKMILPKRNSFTFSPLYPLRRIQDETFKLDNEVGEEISHDSDFLNKVQLLFDDKDLEQDSSNFQDVVSSTFSGLDVDDSFLPNDGSQSPEKDQPPRQLNQTYIVSRTEQGNKSEMSGFVQNRPSRRSFSTAVAHMSDGWQLEEEMKRSFHHLTGTLKRRINACTREGILRTSFNYLLLDPRKLTSALFREASDGERQNWQQFLNGIFYIGKGNRSRPFSHLQDAIKSDNESSCPPNQKVETILDIWKSGKGVICIQAFHHSLHAEALTREAAMIQAKGLTTLTNIKGGDYYGSAASWDEKTRLRYGQFLLQRTFFIFLHEGEVQLRPEDIKGSRKK